MVAQEPDGATELLVVIRTEDDVRSARGRWLPRRSGDDPDVAALRPLNRTP